MKKTLNLVIHHEHMSVSEFFLFIMGGHRVEDSKLRKRTEEEHSELPQGCLNDDG